MQTRLRCSLSVSDGERRTGTTVGTASVNVTGDKHRNMESETEPAGVEVEFKVVAGEAISASGISASGMQIDRIDSGHFNRLSPRRS